MDSGWDFSDFPFKSPALVGNKTAFPGFQDKCGLMEPNEKRLRFPKTSLNSKETLREILKAV